MYLNLNMNVNVHTNQLQVQIQEACTGPSVEMFSNVNLYVNLRRLASYLFTADVRSTDRQNFEVA